MNSRVALFPDSVLRGLINESDDEDKMTVRGGSAQPAES